MNRRTLLAGCCVLPLLPKHASGAGQRFTPNHLLSLIDTPGARFVGQRFLAGHPELADQGRLRDTMLQSGRMSRLKNCASESQLAVLYQSWCRADFQQQHSLQLSGSWFPMTELAACGLLVLGHRG